MCKYYYIIRSRSNEPIPVCFHFAGFTPDVIKFFSETKPTVPEQCQEMLRNWFDEDDDANLDNLAYIMDGLEMVAATDCVKKILESTEKMDDSSE